ncbi:mucosal addressin cell adhesion molecule 1 [Gymnogyps californianus]|uniref:mucosal addressin cell adhesion molecule 1 n=1 Tax=Gymnogyps californianus TaxID=33616 RepID=UPI0021CA31DB|nr:mucosal addressin cell adhesion molecule 1 [Gymnogyps californianus]
MEPAPLLLLLGLLWGCSGRPADKLAVTPQQPVVRYGGSVQLNCSLACAGGTVQWKGLDTNLGSITSFPTHSILHISRAMVATEGTKICQGTCHGQRYQHAVDLKVYALPDTLQLEAEPRALEPGQPGTLHCSAQRVYPLVGLVLTWYRGDQVLEKADFDVMETDEELFDIMATLLVAGEEVGEGMEFRCEVTLSIGQETFTRVASVAVSTGAVTEQTVAMATSTGSPRTVAAMTGSPSTAGPVTTTALPPEPSVPTRDPTTALTNTPREPDAETILEPAAATEPPSTEHPAPRDLVAGSPTACPATTALPGSGTASPPAEKGTGPSVGTVPACSLRIWSLPPNGTRGRALRIECRARCTGNATVRWLRTPVALSQYREEAEGSSSTLQLDHAEPRHQGHYQCILLGHRSQVVSLQLTVSDDWFSTGPAIAAGTTVSLLGLIVTGIVSHCLWKRFRSQYELP